MELGIAVYSFVLCSVTHPKTY